MSNIVVKLFGDSILGRIVQDAPFGRYRKLDPLEKIESGDFELELVNCTRFGCTLSKARHLIEQTLDRIPACRVVLLEYGGNDCNFDWHAIGQDPQAEHLPVTPLTEFRRLYLEILDLLRQANILPLMMNLPPIDSEKFYSTWIAPDENADRIVTWMGDKEQIYRWHELYSREVELIAGVSGTPLIDVRSSFLETRDYHRLICADGIHPNAEGHALMQRVVEAWVSDNGRQFFAGALGTA